MVRTIRDSLLRAPSPARYLALQSPSYQLDGQLAIGLYELGNMVMMAVMPYGLAMAGWGALWKLFKQ